MLPKVTGPEHVTWLDLLLGQVEQRAGLAGRADRHRGADRGRRAGWPRWTRSPRPRPGWRRWSSARPTSWPAWACARWRSGAQPAGYAGGDAFHYPLLRILVAARGHGLQAIDGPYAAIADTDGLRRAAASVAALGYDGKWVLHPGQVDVVNAAFSPAQADYDRAELILDAYEYHTTVAGRGAAMLDGEMIDEASRKLALVAAARGRAAGLRRTTSFEPPAG